MTTTVGRIEYIVGADGSVLTKESRDVAKAAGKVGGKVYSDEMLESFRKKWGGASGFAATLGKYDKSVINQFQKLGGFTSKAFATRFEKTLVPSYQKTADRMVRYLQKLDFSPLNGLENGLKRIFGESGDTEQALRRVKGIIEELQATSQMGIIPKDSFDVVAVNKFGRAIDEAIKLENWEFLTETQRRSRDLMLEESAAAEELARQAARRLDLQQRSTDEAARYQQFLHDETTSIEKMLRDRGEFADLSDDETVRLIQQAGLWDEMSASSREYWAVQERGWAREQEAIDLTLAGRARQAEFDRIFSQGVARQGKDFAELARQVSEANSELDGIQINFTKLKSASAGLGPLLAKPWKSLDNDVRLVIGLIASAADQIAVLGSAAGAGFLGLGAAATTGIGGLIGFVVQVTRLNQELDELPPELRGAKRELEGFTSAFGRLADEMTIAGAAGLTSGFARLQESIADVTDDTTYFGEASGLAFARFADSLRPGSENLKELQDLIRNVADQLPELGDATGVWGTAILRALNRAMPLADDFLNWIELLGQRFLDFTRTDAFGQWIENSRRVWREFGELLDATARTLNNLSTPPALERTVDLLDNLTRLMPGLEAFLDILGRLDIVGIFVEALADIGEILAPVREELGLVADALRTGLFASLQGITPVLVAVTTALQPFLAALAGVLNAISPETWSALAAGATLYFVALSAFTKLSAISGILVGLSNAAISAFDSLTGSKLQNATGKVDSLTDKFGKAGLAGAVIGASVAIGFFVSDAIRGLSDIERKARDVVASGQGIEAAYDEVRGSFASFATEIDDYGSVFEELQKKQENFLSGSDVLWNQNQRNADTLQQAFRELDKPLSDLANKSLPQAQEQFQAMVEDMGLTSEQAQVMLNEMPQLSAAFLDAAGGSDGLATSQEALEFALFGASGGAAATRAEVDLLGGSADGTRQDISALSDAVRNFGDTQITTLEASSQFEQALDDLTLSVSENGFTLDLNTQQGRDNQASLFDSIQATKDLASATLEETGSIDAANAVLSTQKQRLYDTLIQMGLTEDQAATYRDMLDRIPPDVYTAAQLDDDQAQADLNRLTMPRTMKIFADIIPSYSKLPPGSQTGFGISGMGSTGGGIYGPGTGTSDTAGLFALSKGEHILTAKDVAALGGQSGVYAFRRALQGGQGGIQNAPGLAGGGAAPAAMGRSLVVEAGAIQVNGALNPQAVAVNVMNRLAERVAG